MIVSICSSSCNLVFVTIKFSSFVVCLRLLDLTPRFMNRILSDVKLKPLLLKLIEKRFLNFKPQEIKKAKGWIKRQLEIS